MKWYLLADEQADACGNMARDSALLDLTAEGGIAFVRTYTWAPYALSFGANEPATKRYDRDEIARRGLAVVRRPTGGRAVWHAEELTYAVAAPEGSLGTLAQSYRVIHETLLAALERAAPSKDGTRAFALAASPPRQLAVDAGACFASPAGGEVVSDLGKVVGSAQLRERGAFLQHGSILLGNRQELVAELTRGTPPEVGAASMRDLLGREVGTAEVAEAVSAAFAARVGELTTLDPELQAALTVRTAMHRSRFADDLWTWRR
jgi:lipoate-protein ligase A